MLINVKTIVYNLLPLNLLETPWSYSQNNTYNINNINMRNLVKGLTLSTALILGLSLTSMAQTPEKKGGHGERPELNLTDAQKAQMKEMREKEKAGRDKFEASLTEEQKAVMKDRTINPKEKKEKLSTMLSKEQLKVMEANKAEAKQRQAEFAKTLTPEQKVEFNKMREKREGMMENKKAGKKPE